MKSLSLLTDEDLFPDCILPDCPTTLSHSTEVAYPTHQHVLPHQKRMLSVYHDDEEGVSQHILYRYVQGGVGSAKSIAAAAMVVKLSLTIDDNRGVVGRRDYPLLWDTTWSDIKECLARLVERDFLDEYHFTKKMFSQKVQGDYRRIEFENSSLITAVETKNILKGLGASYGFYLIDDAMETDEAFFLGDETNAGLMSRLRLPRVAMHHQPDGQVTDMLHGMILSNPPPTNHWLHKLFGKTQRVFKIGDDYVDTMIVETFLNPFTGAKYAKRIMAMQSKAGRDINTARRVIYGESQPAYGGVKVYPQFRHENHVGEWKFNRFMPLVVSWDFGHQHPSIGFSQVYKCLSHTNHYRRLSEITDQFAITVHQLYQKYKQHILDYYPDAVIYHCGDVAGYRSNSANKDGRSDMKVLIVDYNLNFVYCRVDLLASIRWMRVLLHPKKPCPCGEEIIQIHRRCELCIEALEGGYRFPKNRTTGLPGDKPIKDHYYDDTMDEWRYGAENFVKWGIPYDGRVVTPPPVLEDTWEWMNRSIVSPFSDN